MSSLSKSSKKYTSVLHSDVSCSLMKSRSDLSNQIRNINNTIKQLEEQNEPKELTEAKRLFDSVDSVIKSAQEKLPKVLLANYFEIQNLNPNDLEKNQPSRTVRLGQSYANRILKSHITNRTHPHITAWHWSGAVPCTFV